MEEKVIKLKITDNSKEAQKNAIELKKDFDKVNASVDNVSKSLNKVESVTTWLERLGKDMNSTPGEYKKIVDV